MSRRGGARRGGEAERGWAGRVAEGSVRPGDSLPFVSLDAVLQPAPAGTACSSRYAKLHRVTGLPSVKVRLTG